jgi:hypothetical protein
MAKNAILESLVKLFAIFFPSIFGHMHEKNLHCIT